MGRRGGRGGRRRGGYGRRDERAEGARDDRAMRDRRPNDRGMYDRRPDDRPRRLSPGYPPRLSPGHRLRHGPRGPSPYGRRRPGSRSPSPYGGRRPGFRATSPYGRRRPGTRSPSPDYRPGSGPSPDHRPRRLRDEDGDRGLPRRGQEDYGRVPYRQERDRFDPPVRVDRGSDRSFDGRGPSGRYDAPPAYMLPNHPSDLRQTAEKESELFGGPSRRSFNINKDREFPGEAGMTVTVSATGLGRTSSLYPGRTSPLPPPPPSPPPRTDYSSVLPAETGFMKGGMSFGAGTASSQSLLHDDIGFQYRDPLRGPYVGSRGIERLDTGRDVRIHRDEETDGLYSSRGTLDSDIAPSMQFKGYAGSSSSMLVKDRPYRLQAEGYEKSNAYAMEGLGRPSQDSVGHGSGRAHRFSESSLQHDSGHDDKILLDSTRQTHSKHPPRTASAGYDRRDPGEDIYLVPESLCGNGSRDSRSTMRDTFGSPLTNLNGREFQGRQYDMERSTQHSYPGDSPTRYRKARDVRVGYSPEADLLELPRRPVRQYDDCASYKDDHELSDREVPPMAYGKGSRSASYNYYDMDIADGPPGREYYTDGSDPYDPSPGREYDMVDDEDGYDARYDRSTRRNVFSRITLPNGIDEDWTGSDQGNHPHPDTLSYGRSKYKPISERLSRPMVHPQSDGATMHGRGGGWVKSGKKRMRADLPQYHGGNNFVRPNKSSKLSDDNHKGTELNHEDASGEEDSPPEGSEEFNKQVHQAFLKLYKTLNESPTMQKSYREAAKGSLSCRVCGSHSRTFRDIDALISHAYDTQKERLKTKHLGFHKALCVLMGWNWRIAPDTSKTHHSLPAEVLNDMKGDLMVWPPVVVVHNSSVASEPKETEAKVVSIEDIEGVLADIGVAYEKAKVKVTHGRPNNQSVFLVKFMATSSGFQEAVRVHEHFAAKNHGKEEFQQMKGGKGKTAAAAADKLEEVLYGHIAFAEDQRYLDHETKKRCVVRSKNEIEAKADATLNLDS